MPTNADAIRVVDEWYSSLDLYQDKLPAKGSITAALHVLGRLRDRFDLRISSHVSGKEAQIAGLSSANIRRVLSEFGETRALSSVAGRSNRGARGDVAKLLDSMQGLDLDRLRSSRRASVLKAMQKRLVVEYVPRIFAVKRVKATFESNAASCRFIGSILENAKASGKAGPVAEYLVGAKLALRFPGKEIRNKRFSTSDAQRGFPADFQVGSTAFHVTVAPLPELLEKCRTNLERGLRVYLVVPDAQVVGTRQNAEMIAPGRISVRSIESFVATNVDEISDFDSENLRAGLRQLLETYNERVDAVELDKSLLIDIPPNLP